MRRLFLKGLLAPVVTLAGDDAHHLLYAMRAKPGDVVTLVDDCGAVGHMRCAAFTADSVTLALVERVEADTEPPIEMTLAACLPKGDKMELMIQKAVELGVTEVQPLESQHVVVRYDSRKAAAKQKRWQKIADEAAKQCGRTRLITVQPVRQLADWLAHRNRENAVLLFCYENETAHTIKETLRALADGIEHFDLLTGPEGGFSLAEAERVEAEGGKSVTLGPRILRAETAAITAMSIVQYEKGDL